MPHGVSLARAGLADLLTPSADPPDEVPERFDR
jgi:hypothetical protein